MRKKERMEREVEVNLWRALKVNVDGNIGIFSVSLLVACPLFRMPDSSIMDPWTEWCNVTGTTHGIVVKRRSSGL